MESPLRKLYLQVFSDPGPLADLIIHVLAILILGGIVWWILDMVIKKLEKKYHERPFFEKNASFFILLKRGGHYSILIFAGISMINLFKAPLIERIIYAFMVLLLSSVVNGIVSSLIPHLERTIAVKTKSEVDNVILGLLGKFSGIIIYTVGFILALDILGLNIMPFIAGASVAGIAVGFAAKDTLSNLIAGILLIIDRPFELGDRIEVWSAPQNSATWGDVISIGLRATKIRTTDNIVIVIPNNEIMKRDIINYTAITEEIRVRIPIGIAYDADASKAKELISNVSLELDWVMKDPPPRVMVRKFGESSVDLEARVWIREPRRRMDTISHITDRVKEVFQQEGIEIPYPRRDIYIKREEP
ncbi:MAG: mechanosensitive ion channel family protein [Deltaproteobacteria bacterium]|nr:mechanosensitive ion channel family protein [Deltaproteobacteria bacterium]